jgi:hypothetical protein
MMLFCKELFCLSPIDEFGKPGPLLNAAFLCGWSLIRDAGLLIDYLVLAFHTRLPALCVISKRRIFITFLCHVFLLDNFGFGSSMLLV